MSLFRRSSDVSELIPTRITRQRVGKVAVTPAANVQPETSMGADPVLVSSNQSSTSRSDPAW